LLPESGGGELGGEPVDLPDPELLPDGELLPDPELLPAPESGVEFLYTEYCGAGLLRRTSIVMLGLSIL
jgi:hypothetical protein